MKWFDEVSMPTVKERVARGTALLDQKRPGWEDKIDLTTLRVESLNFCVLGQVFGFYLTGLERVGRDIRPDEYGFAGRTTQEYVELNQAWRDLIIARRFTHTPSITKKKEIVHAGYTYPEGPGPDGVLEGHDPASRGTPQGVQHAHVGGGQDPGRRLEAASVA